ncbi:hypothetical protein IPAKJDPM_00210 [Aeromonas phage avDM14-QBC]|nr:hypothetical protein IPAKJDPM_00210 [Aeromonas phage avDM14-QBC]UYD58768.1 hypothetical protein HNNIDBEH_00175 [Aeromonas phage avDM10-HWA]UYD58928.1 hypothetical protein OFOPOMKI_00078 [Aeromonas phage avDM7-IJDJ]
MKKFRFKSEEAMRGFSALSDTNNEIAEKLKTSVFYALVSGGEIEEVSIQWQSADLFPDYFPIFFESEIKKYLEEVTDENAANEITKNICETNKVDQLLAENMDLRSRLAKLETRLNRIEKLV